MQAAADRIPTATPLLASTLTRIVLTGFMGAGKTTTGRALAAALGWEFLDLDRHIEARAGATVAELFARGGEAAFRKLESSALANALSRERTVLALGGGAPECLTNRLLLEQTPGTRIVFLHAPFPVLFDRCMLEAIASPAAVRPVLASAEAAQARYTERQPLYRRLAHLTLDISAMHAEDAAQAIALQLAEGQKEHR